MHKNHQLARGLASLGRGDDSMLVHMTPHEVQGLQSLALAHGTTLTVNPHTGLPEAGALSAILPILGSVAAVALAPYTGGTSLALMGALGGGIGGAIGSGAENGWNAQSMLAGGAMGALGGYGIGGVGGALAGAGQTAAQGAASTAASQGIGQAAAQGAGQSVAQSALTAGQQAGQGVAGQMAQAGMQNGVQPIAQQAAASAAPAAAAPAASAAPASVAMPANSNQAIAAGWKDLAAPGGATPSSVFEKLTATQKAGLASAGLGAMSAMSETGSGGGGGGKANYYMTSFDPRSQTYGPGVWTKNHKTIQNFLASNGDMPEMAGGGEVDQQKTSLPTQAAPVTLGDYFASMATGATSPNAMPAAAPSAAAQNQYQQGIASVLHTPMERQPFQPGPAAPPATGSAPSVPLGNTTAATNPFSLKKKKQGKNAAPTPVYYQYDPATRAYGSPSATPFAEGGGVQGHGVRFLQGPGDGVSDDIPAVIDHADGSQEPARLADGEVVIDANSVSLLGNGSSAAGARALIDMMARLRKGRIAKRGEDKNPLQHLPA